MDGMSEMGTEMDNEKTHVYWIYGEGMVLLYVGVTGDVDRRMRQHSEKTWWAEVRRIDTEEYATLERAREVEVAEIKARGPKYNAAHNAVAPTKARVPRVNARGNRRWLSQAEAADYLGVTTRTMRNYVARGDVTGYRIKGSRLMRFDQAEIDAMLAPIPTVGTL